MSTFKIGQKVKCIVEYTEEQKFQDNMPEVGQVYTVLGVIDKGTTQMICLLELEIPDGHGMPFFNTEFFKIVDRTHETEVNSFPCQPLNNINEISLN